MLAHLALCRMDQFLMALDIDIPLISLDEFPNKQANPACTPAVPLAQVS